MAGTNDKAGPLGIAVVIGVAAVIGWWMLRKPTPKEPAAPSGPESGAITRHCAGFDSEETAKAFAEAARKGDKGTGEALERSMTHFEAGDAFAVTARSGSLVRIDGASKGVWWVSVDCTK